MIHYSGKLSAVPKRMTDLWRVHDGQLVVLSDAHFNLRTYRLNEVGALVWQLVDGIRTVSLIIAEVAARFPAGEQSIIADDVCRFIDDLAARHVITLTRDNPVDVLLIVPPLSRYYAADAAQVAENSAPPLGLLYMAAVLRAAGIRVAVRDMVGERLAVADCMRLLKEHSPRMIGVTVLTGVADEVGEMLRLIKGLAPEIITVVGGIHPSAVPEHMLCNRAVDYVVRGEGEMTLLALCQGLLGNRAVSEIPGVCTRACIAQEAPCVADIDQLPLPARDLVNMDMYMQKGAVLSSRGCPYGCYFCSSVGMHMHRHRLRRPDLVAAELQEVSRGYGIREFEFQDDNFTGDAGRCRTLCAAIRPLNFSWGCQGTLRQLASEPDLLERMVEAGCAHIFFGLETGNDALLRRLKGASVADVKRVVTNALRLGVHVAAGFIVGHPEDDVGSIKDSLALALWLRERDVHTPVGVLNCFPGSPVHRNPAGYGLELLSTNYSEYMFPKVNIATPAFSADDLRRIYVDFVCEIAKTYADKS